MGRPPRGCVQRGLTERARIGSSWRAAPEQPLRLHGCSTAAPPWGAGKRQRRAPSGPGPYRWARRRLDGSTAAATGLSATPGRERAFRRQSDFRARRGLCRRPASFDRPADPRVREMAAAKPTRAKSTVRHPPGPPAGCTARRVPAVPPRARRPGRPVEIGPQTRTAVARGAPPPPPSPLLSQRTLVKARSARLPNQLSGLLSEWLSEWYSEWYSEHLSQALGRLRADDPPPHLPLPTVPVVARKHGPCAGPLDSSSEPYPSRYQIRVAIRVDT